MKNAAILGLAAFGALLLFLILRRRAQPSSKPAAGPWDTLVSAIESVPSVLQTWGSRNDTGGEGIDPDFVDEIGNLYTETYP